MRAAFRRPSRRTGDRRRGSDPTPVQQDPARNQDGLASAQAVLRNQRGHREWARRASNDELLDRHGVCRLIGVLRERQKAELGRASEIAPGNCERRNSVRERRGEARREHRGLALDPERSVEVRVELNPRNSGWQADQGHAIVEAAACGSGAGIGSAVRVDGDEDDIARGQHRGGRQGHTECQKPMYVIRSGDARDIGYARARVTCGIRIGLVERRDGCRRRQRGTSPDADESDCQKCHEYRLAHRTDRFHRRRVSRIGCCL